MEKANVQGTVGNLIADSVFQPTHKKTGPKCQWTGFCQQPECLQEHPRYLMLSQPQQHLVGP
jgi:hypothetical protein